MSLKYEPASEPLHNSMRWLIASMGGLADTGCVDSNS